VPAPADQLATFDERARAAEVQYVKATSKSVDMSLESCEILVELIEMGEGREPDVLREALAVGLRARKRVREVPESIDEETVYVPQPPPLEGGTPSFSAPLTLGGLVAAAAGAPMHTRNAALSGEEVLPPSQRRPRAETDGPDE
jgi:hypothetical protein